MQAFVDRFGGVGIPNCWDDPLEIGVPGLVSGAQHTFTDRPNPSLDAHFVLGIENSCCF
jgi:hypothetical protein